MMAALHGSTVMVRLLLEAHKPHIWLGGTYSSISKTTFNCRTNKTQILFTLQFLGNGEPEWHSSAVVGLQIFLYQTLDQRHLRYFVA